MEAIDERRTQPHTLVKSKGLWYSTRMSSTDPNLEPDNERSGSPLATKRRALRWRAVLLLLLLVFALVAVDGYLLLSRSSPATTPVAQSTPEATLAQANAANTPSSVAATPAGPTAQAGWTIHHGAGFQIALPSSWQEIQLDDTTLRQEIETASRDNPHLADQLTGILSSGQNKNFVFYAVDTLSKGLVVSNLSVARTTVPAGMPVSQVVEAFAGALPQLLKGSRVVAQNAPLNLNGQQAGEVDYDLPLVNSAGQLVTVRGIQYIFLPKSGDAYIVTVSGDAAQADQWVLQAKLIAQSFQPQ